MEELIEKVENLKKALDKTEQVKSLKTYKEEIMKEEELLKLIEEYKKTSSEVLKEKIINNELFREYKKKETDINLMILEINQKLKELKNEGNGCQ